MSFLGKQAKMKKALWNYSLYANQMKQKNSEAFLLFFHINHIKAAEWRQYQSKLFELDPQVKVQYLHNNLFSQSFAENFFNIPYIKEQYYYGPLCVAYCPTIHSYKKLFLFMAKKKEFKFITVCHHNQFFSTTDNEVLLKQDISVYHKFLQNISSGQPIGLTLVPQACIAPQLCIIHFFSVLVYKKMLCEQKENL